jgi:transglutaminase-like putative cysteine protease
MSSPARSPVEAAERFYQWSLLGLMTSGFLALVGTGALDWPTTLLTSLALVVRGAVIAGLLRLHLNPAWVAAATLAYVGFYPLDVQYLTREFIPATIHLICFLSAARLLTARTDRDYLFVKVLSLLQLISATLLGAKPNYFFFLILFVAFGVACLCCAEIRNSSRLRGQTSAIGSRFQRRLAALAASVTVAILLMTAGLFVILPRTAQAAFRTLLPNGYRLSGFSNEVQLGQIGELKKSSVPVMRVEFENDLVAQRTHRWRGAALSQFDGKRWYNTGLDYTRVPLERGRMQPLVTDDQRRRAGTRVSYSVELDAASGTDTLFFLGTPEFIITSRLDQIYQASNGTYTAGSANVTGLRYGAVSHSSDEIADDFAFDLSPDERVKHLLLPPTDSRVIELARSIGGDNLSPLRRSAAIERFLKNQFRYSAELERKPVSDPIAHFLLTRKEGHCEYFASAMAVMLRVVHVPSRVVTGFYGGTYNPLTDRQIIRASDAHSWVEAFIPGRGWVTFDPTPPGPAPSALQRFAATLLLYADAFDATWRRWVVEYDLERQVDLVARIEQNSRTFHAGIGAQIQRLLNWLSQAGEAAWLNSGPLSLGALCIAAVGLIATRRFGQVLGANRHRLRVSSASAAPTDATLLYSRMLQLLRRRGLKKPGWLTPGEFAAAAESDAAMGGLVRQFTDEYYGLRYRHDHASGSRMLTLLDQMQKAASRR